MEETKMMTAERSLEIIGEVMEQNRRRVTGFLRTWLLVAGRTTIGVAVLLGALGVCLGMKIDFIGLLIPLVVYLVMKRVERGVPQSSLGVVGTWVKQVWVSFTLMAFAFAFFGYICNYLLIRYADAPSVVVPVWIDVFESLWLLLGMAVCVTGFLLRRNVLVVCGLMVGVLCFLFWHFSVLGNLCICFLPVDVNFMGSVWRPLQVSFAVFVFSLVGMILPAMLLKKECK